VTANLANFAYDPINFLFLREANVLDIFLEVLASSNETLVLHGIAGICNICVEPESRDYILAAGGFELIAQLLARSDNTEIILNCITTLIFLLNAKKDSLEVSSGLVDRIRKLKDSENLRIKKLATLFLEDHC
jgi:hypothetical protein